MWKLSGFSAPRCGGQRSPWAAPGERCQHWDMDHDPPGYGGGGVFFLLQKMKPNYIGEWESCMEDGNIFRWFWCSPKMKPIYHLESRWRNVPCIWFIIAPYIVDTFWGVASHLLSPRCNISHQRGKGTSSWKVPWDGICDRSLEGIQPYTVCTIFHFTFLHCSILTTFVWSCQG